MWNQIYKSVETDNPLEQAKWTTFRGRTNLQ